MKVIGGLLIVLLIVAISLGGFYLNRWWNWNFAYRLSVQSEVKTMVKPECLKP